MVTADIQRKQVVKLVANTDYIAFYVSADDVFVFVFVCGGEKWFTLVPPFADCVKRHLLLPTYGLIWCSDNPFLFLKLSYKNTIDFFFFAHRV